MTQSIVVQVGQAGNQIGHRFWDLALREHASVNKKGLYDSALSTFFVNGDAENSVGKKQRVSGLKARAVLIDMEEGVVGEVMKSDLGRLFDHQQLVTDVSGSGNNWAVGHHFYGRKYHDHILETVRKAAELCECLQCFFIIHSMGGGTGSGIGTYVTRLLADEMPDVHRLVTAVYPSPDDDVITSPYNSVLAMRQLTEFADCVIPVENQRLAEIAGKVQEAAGPGASSRKLGSVISGAGGVERSDRPFDAMNNVVANMLLNLTCSSRFEGTLNVDLNEISMNLVPFPRLHYLCAAQSPLYTLPGVVVPPRRIDQMFSDSFTKEFQLLSADPKRHLYMACALLLRGSVDVSDVRRNIDKMQGSLRFANWNLDGWKVGHCNVAPSGQKYALLNLANNTCIQANMQTLIQRFTKLFKRKAHIHHYTQVDEFEECGFTESINSLVDLREEYCSLEKKEVQVCDGAGHLQRLKISG